MTDCEQGDVVLVRFIFTDETGAKRRPAVIISTGDYHRGRQEAIIAAITSNVDRLLVGDHLIAGWQEAGLLFPSVATGYHPNHPAGYDRTLPGGHATGRHASHSGEVTAGDGALSVRASGGTMDEINVLIADCPATRREER